MALSTSQKDKQSPTKGEAHNAKVQQKTVPIHSHTDDNDLSVAVNYDGKYEQESCGGVFRPFGWLCKFEYSEHYLFNLLVYSFWASFFCCCCLGCCFLCCTALSAIAGTVGLPALAIFNKSKKKDGAGSRPQEHSAVGYAPLAEEYVVAPLQYDGAYIT